MNKKIVLFGAGKSATDLIEYLIAECEMFNWHLTVADSNLPLAQSKVGSSRYADAVELRAEQPGMRSDIIQSGDLVISLLPPELHFLVAVDCLAHRKNLLTASYLDEKMLELKLHVESANLLFLCEMGLDPGIDHMSAMELIHRIKSQGGEIISFRSHCGGLVAPESDDNPWHYKISWNPRNIVTAGTGGATFKEDGVIVHKPYEELFADCESLLVPNLATLAFYPNRDSLAYIPLYGLQGAATFMRTTLRYPAFCKAWNAIVKAGLTNANIPVQVKDLTFKKWSHKILPFVNTENRQQLEFLGLFDDRNVPDNTTSSAGVLQYLLEEKLLMHSGDKDMIVLFHEIEYEISGTRLKNNSLLVIKGQDSLHTAMSKSVGLPLGIAASLILRDVIRTKGLHIPILPEIYQPVLAALQSKGFVFDETAG